MYAHIPAEKKETLKCMTVRVVKKKFCSTACPISEVSACFADASPSPSLGGAAVSVLLFFRGWWGLSYFVLTVFCRLGNLYLCWRELDRLHDDSRFICSHEGWQGPAWCRGVIITSSLAERLGFALLCFAFCFAFALPCPAHSATVAEAFVLQTIPSYPDVRLKWE